jgi:hypothetical protein
MANLEIGDLPSIGRNLAATDRLVVFQGNSETQFATPDEASAGLGWRYSSKNANFFIEPEDNNTIFIVKPGAGTEITATFRDSSEYTVPFNCIVVNDSDHADGQVIIAGESVELDQSESMQFALDNTGEWVAVGGGSGTAYLTNNGEDTITVNAADTISLTAPIKAYYEFVDALNGFEIRFPNLEDSGLKVGDFVMLYNRSGFDAEIQYQNSTTIDFLPNFSYTIIRIISLSPNPGSVRSFTLTRLGYAELSKNLSDLPDKGAARDNIDLGSGDSVIFATLQTAFIRNLISSATDEEVQRLENTGGGGVLINYEAKDDANAMTVFMRSTMNMLDRDAGLTSGQWQVKLTYEGGFPTALTLLGNGLHDTQLNYTDEDKRVNSLNALGIGPSSSPTFHAILFERATGTDDPYIEFYNTGTATDNILLDWYAKNSANAKTKISSQQIALTTTTAGAENSEGKLTALKSGALVDALIYNGDGLKTFAQLIEADAFTEIPFLTIRNTGSAVEGLTTQWEGKNENDENVTFAQSTASFVANTPGAYRAEIYIKVAHDSDIITVATFNGSGLNDTQLNYSDSTKRTNTVNQLGLGTTSTPSFAGLTISSGTPTVTRTNTGAAGASVIDIINGNNSAVASVRYASVTYSLTTSTAGNESSQCVIEMRKNGALVSDALTLNGDGLKNTQLNYTDSTKRDNTLNQLGLGTTSSPTFAALTLASTEPDLIRYHNGAAGGTSVDYFNANNSAAASTTFIRINYEPTVSTAGNESGQMVIEARKNGVLVTDALTVDGDGLQDTQINFTDATKLTNTQTELQIIGAQQELAAFYPSAVGPATLYSYPMSNGSTYETLTYLQTGLTYGELSLIMPKRWNKSAITLIFDWVTPSSSLTNVVWYLEYALSDPDTTGNILFGGQVTASSEATGADKFMRVTINLPIAELPVNIDDNSRLQLRLYRSGGAGVDTLPANAFLVNPVIIQYTSDSGNDA